MGPFGPNEGSLAGFGSGTDNLRRGYGHHGGGPQVPETTAQISLKFSVRKTDFDLASANAKVDKAPHTAAEASVGADDGSGDGGGVRGEGGPGARVQPAEVVLRLAVVILGGAGPGGTQRWWRG